MTTSREDFLAGKGTRFIQEGTEVVICRDDIPVSRVPASDLLEYAKKLIGIERHLWP